ncbi:hypothetical protein TeGR_g7735 [Tetraparma gracilis]|uniref:Uncharacterized protein n=1 Tax=Tetraparma gracilis TaxID=2962635 RepID=A0ABQ6N3G1_9STRA|nr:hypothetical protein TeGR_g7735 [Tetraparma gracilis]
MEQSSSDNSDSQPGGPRRKSIGELGLEIEQLRKLQADEETETASTRSGGAYAVIEKGLQNGGGGGGKSERQRQRDRRRSSIEALGDALKEGIKKLVGA